MEFEDLCYRVEAFEGNLGECLKHPFWSTRRSVTGPVAKAFLGSSRCVDLTNEGLRVEHLPLGGCGDLVAHLAGMLRVGCLGVRVQSLTCSRESK